MTFEFLTGHQLTLVRKSYRLFDVSKQVVGQMFVHGVNLLISDVTAHRSGGGNACVFYFLNILIDTTLGDFLVHRIYYFVLLLIFTGVALIYIILRFLTYLLSQKLQLKGFESGQYGSPPSFAYWAKQAAVYVLALTSMKLLVVVLLATIPGIVRVGKWLLSWTQIMDSDALQVILCVNLLTSPGFEAERPR
jgi:hypothetical protein